MRRETDAAVEREAEREHMSPAERRFEEESVDDIQADAFVSEHLGGINPERLIEDDEPPRN
jgi:hypothetical protein